MSRTFRWHIYSHSQGHLHGQCRASGAEWVRIYLTQCYGRDISILSAEELMQDPRRTP